MSEAAKVSDIIKEYLKGTERTRHLMIWADNSTPSKSWASVDDSKCPLRWGSFLH